MKGMKGGSMGGGKIQPVKGKEGIMSGGASKPSTKPAQGHGGYGFAPECKTKMPSHPGHKGGKKMGGM